MAEVIRPFRLMDAQATRDVFVRAVRDGAAPLYSAAEIAVWLGDPVMPEGWGDWLAGHITFVAEDWGRITGFMMLERDGYLNMAFVLPEVMGTGTADRLYAEILAAARALDLPRLTVFASRHARRFFARHGWRPDRMLALPEGMERALTEGDNPITMGMVLEVEP
ncbi:GNAT family N-acetyltransferase [Neotabrizicola shimadae]|uniref:GNAT family N-acetyltransferase n=1 Tax=Neotabrizicola shimadae TaxID=2807096 RepID=A0A8G0ZV66_9RHOB|nr:GNAT family N-acetyltransferase [Neotabrizicola shimadae]QYZ70743.1 GNAT family N-acetyltransferase [Neotabrizicola shimadae]